MTNFPQEIFKSSESTKMTLTDMAKLKELANNISFMRLFFLKKQQSRATLQNPETASTNLEIIDCVLAIFLFELTRVVRTGRALFRRDQFQFQVLHFFCNLKACKVIEKGDARHGDDST